MTFPVLSDVLWAASAAGHLGLLFVLLWRKLPNSRVLTLYMAFAPLESLILFLVSRHGDRHQYAVAYSLLGVLSYAFQLSMIYELARNVLRPLDDIFNYQMVLVCVTLGALALGMFSFVLSSHLDQRTLILIWENRVSVFVSASICAGIITVFLVMNRYYLALKKHAREIAQGLFVWHYSLLVQDILHASISHRLVHLTTWYTATDYVVELIYLAVLFYWIIAFWKNEEEQRPMPDETRAGILNAYEAIKRGESLEEFRR